MIFYFTGTGNSLAAAQTIARATDDLLVDIGAAYKYKDFDFTLAQGEQLGFVFPVYNYTTPPIIDAFLKRARFRTGNKETFTPDYCFAVISCGAFVGSTARVFGKRLLAGAELAARETANRIAAREHVRAEHRNPLGIVLSKFTEKDEKPRSTSEFFALPTCTSCGQCADLCPTNTITIIEGAPRWAELGCTQCLACLHRCPVNAIQYGAKTERRGRYVNPVLAKAPKRA